MGRFPINNGKCLSLRNCNSAVSLKRHCLFFFFLYFCFCKRITVTLRKAFFFFPPLLYTLWEGLAKAAEHTAYFHNQGFISSLKTFRMPISDTHLLLSIDFFFFNWLASQFKPIPPLVGQIWLILLTPVDGTLHRSHLMPLLLSTYCKYYNLKHTYYVQNTLPIFVWWIGSLDYWSSPDWGRPLWKRQTLCCCCVCVCATLRFRIYLSTLRLFRPCFFRLPRTSLPPSGGRSIRGFSSKKTVQMLDNAKPISLLDCTCLYSQVWQKKKKGLLSLNLLSISSTLCALVPFLDTSLP